MVHTDRDIDFSVIEAIKKTGRNIEDYVRSSTIGLVAVDYFYYKKILKDLNPQKALKLYSYTWNKDIEKKILEYSSKMRMSEVYSIPVLGRIAMSFFDERCCPLKPIEDSSNRYVGIVIVCPFVEYTTTLFHEEIGCPYHRLLARHSEAFLNLLVDLTGLKDHVEAKQDRFMCEGDSFCRIIFEKRH